MSQVTGLREKAKYEPMDFESSYILNLVVKNVSRDSPLTEEEVQVLFSCFHTIKDFIHHVM